MAESRVEGLEETLATLDAMPKQLVLGGFNQAFFKSANVIEDKLGERTPIRLAEARDGTLIVEGGSLKMAVMSVVVLDSGYRGGYVEVGFGKLGYIANFLEYGHRMVGHRPGLKYLGFDVPAGGRWRNAPFMSPAAAEAAEPAIDVFAKSLEGTVSGWNSK